MHISLIVAADENNVIGGGNTLLWKLPKDMQHFRDRTKSHTVIMGRKTFDSIGRPLPGRRNIVVSRDVSLMIPGCEVAPSLAQGLKLAEQGGEVEVFVIGGGQIYTQALPEADRVYFTRVHSTFTGDVVFPVLDNSEWKEISAERHEADNEHPHAFTFLTYERRA